MTTKTVRTGAGTLCAATPSVSVAGLPGHRDGRGRRLWFGAFFVERGRVYLRKTGNSATLDRRLIAEVASWLAFQLALRVASLRRRLSGGRGPAIWFTPDRPGPWYMVSAAATRAGLRIASAPEHADVSFFFEDATTSAARAPGHLRGFNFGCTDISKSRVAEVFAEVFGYPLAIDPRSFVGVGVEKGEVNGAHDGRMVECPMSPLPGRVYQRLVDTVGADGLACDLRTHCVGGRPVVVWVKRRAAEARFLPPNLFVSTHSPSEIFTVEELRLIERFAQAMRLDWGGLDILRDRSDGHIYVVDVNKTDAGPITSLSLRQKLASTAMLAGALAAMVAVEAA